ncbi:hypothetical protein [Spirosoma validum]|uniref:hypothetical protein n=1 Tax=Spirosoma validum TaxID=2771355 RepID=UPI001CC31870|nr:hypothetical protein [Spirosoma validum]
MVEIIIRHPAVLGQNRKFPGALNAFSGDKCFGVAQVDLPIAVRISEPDIIAKLLE